MRTRKTLLALVALVAAAMSAMTMSSAASAAPSSASVAQQNADFRDASPEARALWGQLQARFGEATVIRTSTEATVTFNDVEGKAYEYTFAKEAAPAGSGTVGPQWDADWSGWKLNRAETLQLSRDGANAAVIYALAVAAGCAPCVVGAVIEQNWAGQAGAYYGRGNCAKIYYWLGITEYSGGYCS